MWDIVALYAPFCVVLDMGLIWGRRRGLALRDGYGSICAISTFLVVRNGNGLKLQSYRRSLPHALAYSIHTIIKSIFLSFFCCIAVVVSSTLRMICELHFSTSHHQRKTLSY